MGIVGGADRIKNGKIRFMVIDFDRFAHEQVFTPARQRDIVVIDDGDNLGAHVFRPEEAEVAPLDAVPTDGVGERSIVFLLIVGRDEDTPFKTIVARRFLVADDNQVPILDRLELQDGFAGRIDRRGCDDLLHKNVPAIGREGARRFASARAAV